MQTIALISQKGGVGKSTLAVHLAALAAEREKVILMDLDPQGSAMEWANRRGDRPPDIMAAHPASIAREIERAAAEGYEAVFIDTAPHADHAALQAARAADLIMIPCRPATFDIAAISATLDLCRLANKQSIVVLNAAPIRSRVVQEAAEAISDKGASISRAIVHQRVAFQHCLIDGRTAAEFEPGGPAANEIAEYLRLGPATRKLRKTSVAAARLSDNAKSDSLVGRKHAAEGECGDCAFGSMRTLRGHMRRAGN